MPNLINITTPINQKGYEYANRGDQTPRTDQVFNLGDTSRVQKPTERTEEYTNRDNKDGSFSVQVSVTKNPSSSMNILRSILNESTAAALGAEGGKDILIANFQGHPQIDGKLAQLSPDAPGFFCAEVEQLLGNPTKAKEKITKTVLQ